MADIPDESATQSQAHGGSSYPFSFPSQPPDIRNWFSSYQYESPEVPELAVDLGGGSGSETQDPLEKYAPGNGDTALKRGCFGSQAEHAEVSATRDFHPLGRSTVEQGTKRKQSLRGLFGAGFLDDHDEGTQTESQAVSALQRTAVDPPWNCNWIGLRGRKRSHEDAVEHSELPTDSEGTCIAETQTESQVAPAAQRSSVDPPWDCNWIGLQNRKRSVEGVVEHSELLTDSEGTCIAETQENFPGGQEIDYRKRPVNCGGASLTRIEESFLEDDIERRNLPVNSHGKDLADAESLRGLFGSGFLDNCDEATQNETRVVSPVLRSAVDPRWNGNWIGLRNRKRGHEGAVEHSELLTDSESTCIAETQVNPPGGQQTNHSKHPVNCGGTSLAADTEAGFLEDGTEHSNLPVNFPIKGLTGSEKIRRSLRELFGAGFFDDCDEANESETRVVSPVHRNAVQPLSKCNAAGLPHIEHIHEGAVGYSELPADHDVISIAETRENPTAGQVIKHSRLPVDCGSMSLAAHTEEGFLKDGIEHRKLSVNPHSNVLADTDETGIEHRTLTVSSGGIGSSVTEENFLGVEINQSKPKLEHNKTKGTAVADGFVAIRTKVKPAEDCRTNKIRKVSTERTNTTLQENRCILGTNDLGQGSTRSPLLDRTNLSEVAGAPVPEISRKWKRPRKGKPYVGPPMTQLRLENWVHRM